MLDLLNFCITSGHKYYKAAWFIMNRRRNKRSVFLLIILSAANILNGKWDIKRCQLCRRLLRDVHFGWRILGKLSHWSIFAIATLNSTWSLKLQIEIVTDEWWGYRHLRSLIDASIKFLFAWLEICSIFCFYFSLLVVYAHAAHNGLTTKY